MATRSLYLEQVYVRRGVDHVRLLAVLLARSYGSSYTHIARALGITPFRVMLLVRQQAEAVARRRGKG